MAAAPVIGRTRGHLFGRPRPPREDAAVRPSFIQRQASHPCARLHKGFRLQIRDMETVAVTECHVTRCRYKASPTANAVSSTEAEILQTLDVDLSVAPGR